VLNAVRDGSVVASGETLRFSCAEHREAWAGRIRGRYLVLERDEWEARGAGYRGPMLGGREDLRLREKMG
jgi:hypothetical protein